METRKRRVISLLVDNQSGVLARVSNLFCRRGFNIDSLTVSATNDPTISRITVTVCPAPIKSSSSSFCRPSAWKSRGRSSCWTTTKPWSGSCCC